MYRTRLFDRTAIALATGLLLTLSPVAATAQQSPDGATTTRTSTPENLATKHTLRGTYFNSGAWQGVPFPGGNAAKPVDNLITVECPGTSTCTIEADVWVEEGDAPLASQGGLCVYIDGITYLCLDNNYSQPGIVGNFAMTVNFTGLAPGTHTIQSYLYSGSGTD